MGELSRKVGRRIKEIREGLKIKQYELAEKLDMEPSNLTRIESGYQMPKEENLEKIASLLGVRVKDLFDFDEEYTREDLILKIVSILKNSDIVELEYVYKLVSELKKMK